MKTQISGRLVTILDGREWGVLTEAGRVDLTVVFNQFQGRDVTITVEGQGEGQQVAAAQVARPKSQSRRKSH
jgi:hypothetical protein